MAHISYNKHYLPGYTGHVPKKNEVFGCTAGDINKIITETGYKPSNFDVDISVGKPQFAQREFYSQPPVQDEQNKQLLVTNNSKKGENWLGGPTANIKAQHIPNYAGYVPQIKSENLYGRSFAKTSGSAINGEYVKGFVPPEVDRFTTTAASEFKKEQFRRLNGEIEPCEVKDAGDAGQFFDAEFQGIEIQEKNAWMNLPTTGYSGHQSLYRNPVTKIQHRKDPFFNVNPLRPRLQTSDVRQTDKFQAMSAGYQKAMESQKAREQAGLPNNTEVRIPIVGYQGHRMGNRSQNFYGKTFRDCAIQSKMVQRMAQ